jgi:hypothetical protein
MPAPARRLLFIDLLRQSTTASEVVRLGGRRNGTGQGALFVRITHLQSCNDVRQRACNKLPMRGDGRSRDKKHDCDQVRFEGCSQDPFHWTRLIGTPTCKGCPVLVPIATTSPAFNPARMATWVRLMAPVVTEVRTSPSFTTLNTYGFPFSE